MDGTRGKIGHYQVKAIEPVVKGADVQARIFTLAPGDVITWHFHRQCADYYFVLAGTLTILTRTPDEKTARLAVGERFTIQPGTEHLITNRAAEDCRFLLVQGVGAYDWVKAAS
jgi:mannose-6-phosphate isomerase-like protein (cupin superfamily)